MPTKEWAQGIADLRRWTGYTSAQRRRKRSQPCLCAHGMGGQLIEASCQFPGIQNCLSKRLDEKARNCTASRVLKELSTDDAARVLSVVHQGVVQVKETTRRRAAKGQPVIVKGAA